MAKSQSASLERKKFFADPILVSMIVVLVVFLLLFILYPLLMLLIDSFYTEGKVTLDVFKRVLSMKRFRTAFGNTVVLGLITGICSTLIGLLFAYVEEYVKVRTKFLEKLFGVVSMLPVVSPPFVLSLSMIMLFGRSGLITRKILGIYDSNVYGLKGIAIVQIMTFFPVCYMMLKGLLKNIDPSLEEATRDMGASRWKVFTSVTLPLLLPGLGNADSDPDPEVLSGEKDRDDPYGQGFQSPHADRGQIGNGSADCSLLPGRALCRYHVHHGSLRSALQALGQGLFPEPEMVPVHVQDFGSEGFP